jgi:hypothetical protein
LHFSAFLAAFLTGLSGKDLTAEGAENFRRARQANREISGSRRSRGSPMHPRSLAPNRKYLNFGRRCEFTEA